MKRQKGADGYRTRHASVRLTETEEEKLMRLYEEAKKNNEGLLLSDFFRKQLLYENDRRQSDNILYEIRKLRTELHQAFARLKYYGDGQSMDYAVTAIEKTRQAMDEIKSRLEGADGNNYP